MELARFNQEFLSFVPSVGLASSSDMGQAVACHKGTLQQSRFEQLLRIQDLFSYS